MINKNDSTILIILDKPPISPIPPINSFRGKYRFLSNFYPSQVYCSFGLKYSTVEAAYQASKTNSYGQRTLFTTYNAKRAKSAGRKLDIRLDWEDIKISIMLGLLRQKFFNHPALKQKLIETGNTQLIEGNYWGDTFWGVYQEVGYNHLGELLMMVRDEVKQHESFRLGVNV